MPRSRVSHGAVSAAARSYGAVPDRECAHEVQLAIAARPEAVDVDFWRAVLGYAGLDDDNAVDPLGHGSTVWMQELNADKPLRHAMHVDVSVPREDAEARIAAAVAAGGPHRSRRRRPGVAGPRGPRREPRLHRQLARRCRQGRSCRSAVATARLPDLHRAARGSWSCMTGKVVVNRAMSLDGFIAGPGHAMDSSSFPRPSGLVAPHDIVEIAAATGAMLIGRRTWDVGEQLQADEPGSYDYPFAGPMFLLTHRPLEQPRPEVTVLTGDIGKAVATALDAAGDKDLELLGADVAGQCLQRELVDEILVYVLPVVLGDGIRFSSPGLERVDLEQVSSRPSGAVTLIRYRVHKQG